MNSDCRRHAGLLRRLGAMLYDGFLLAGVMIVAAIPLPFFQSAADGSAWVRALIQIYLILVCFLFFGWFWTHGGQTLGMRAWRLQLCRIDGQNLAWSTAVVRFLSALLSWLALGLGFFWVAIDPQNRAWHDRLSKSIVVVLPRRP